MTLDEIHSLCDESAEGPWEAQGTLVKFPCYKSPSGYDSMDLDRRNPDNWIPREVDTCDGRCIPTARFIAAARDLVPRLLEVARAAKAVGCRGSDEMNPEWIRLFKSLLDLEA